MHTEAIFLDLAILLFVFVMKKKGKISKVY